MKISLDIPVNGAAWALMAASATPGEMIEAFDTLSTMFKNTENQSLKAGHPEYTCWGEMSEDAKDIADNLRKIQTAVSMRKS